MTIILSERPSKPVPQWAAIDELYPEPGKSLTIRLRRPKSLLSLRKMLHMVDRALKLYNGLPIKPGRDPRHQEGDGVDNIPPGGRRVMGWNPTALGLLSHRP